MALCTFTVSAKRQKDANNENDDLIDLDKDKINEWKEMKPKPRNIFQRILSDEVNFIRNKIRIGSD